MKCYHNYNYLSKIIASVVALLFIISLNAQNVISIGPSNGTNGTYIQILGGGLISGVTTSVVATINSPVLIRTGTNTSSATPTSLTISGFNCTGGNYLVIAIAASTAAIRTISSVTTGTGGQTATNIITATYNGATTGKAALYGVVNPTTGDIVVTMSGSCTILSVTAMLFNNVGGSGATSDSTAGSDSSASARTSTSDNLTSLSTDLIVDSLAYNATVGAPTKGGSQTLISQTTGTASLAFIANSTQPGVVGTATMSWTFASQVVTWVGVVLHGK